VDSKVCIYEEVYNDNGKVVQKNDYRESPVIEQRFYYNPLGELIELIENQEGVENSKQTFVYDECGDVIDEKLYIGGGLYEHTVIEKTATTFIKKLIRNGEEIELFEKIIDGENWSSKTFHNEELVESYSYVYHPQERLGVTSYKNYQNDFIAQTKEKYNDKNEVILNEDFHENGTLLTSVETVIEDGLIFNEIVKNFFGDESYYESFYTYDERKNLIKFECRSLSGALMSFHTRKFDDNNRVVEEKGFSNGHFSGITGIHSNHDKFHFIHEYQVVV
jgi:hypothetical protein